MHEAYWGLQHSPFQLSEHAGYIFASPAYTEALARLHFLVRECRPLGILSGSSGSGKSLLLTQFAKELRGEMQPVCLLNLLGVEPRELLWSLAAGLQTNPRIDQGAFALQRAISDRIRENRYQGLQTVVLLDDADEAPHEVLIHVLRLLKTHASDVTVVMAVEPSRITRLGGDLIQLSQLRIHLDPWEESDVRQYIRTGLVNAGGMPDVFDDSAILRLRDLTCGVPRWVRELAQLALLAGASRHQQHIDGETIECAYQELSAAYQEQPAGAGHRGAGSLSGRSTVSV
jgi:general secretion pathway protein A